MDSTETTGRLRIRKEIVARPVERTSSRKVEEPVIDRVKASAGDSGQIETLPDGSISIPVLEERLVVRRELVVRERIIVRKVTKRQRQQISATLRRERIEVTHEPAEER